MDHVVPISLGGKDEPENWVTTSMMNNLSKSNFTLKQLGWTLKPRGSIAQWDGLSHDFIRIVEQDPTLLATARIRDWYTAASAFFSDSDYSTTADIYAHPDSGAAAAAAAAMAEALREEGTKK